MLFCLFLSLAASAPSLMGGKEISRQGAPWQVLVSSLTDLGVHEDCGGTIIDKRVVLTAAHCVAKEMTVIILDKSRKERVASGGGGAIYEEVARGELSSLQT